MAKVQIRIKNGKVVFEALGLTGPSCDQATAPLEALLAGAVLSEDKKPEYFEAETSLDQQVEQ